MDLETAQTNTTAKLPLLKQENGNLVKPAAQTTTNAEGTLTTLIPGPYKDAKTLFAAIQTRFGGNDATKKTQKTLLKKMYENFSAPNTDSLDSIFNRLQKIWNTHVVVWRNKPDLDTMSFDDIYNNFKIVEQEVKGTAAILMKLILLIDQPNGSHLVHEDLEQIHEDDLEEMDLKWHDTAGYDKSKVECFNCHKLGYFARECRGPRNQDNRSRNQDSSRRTINVEEISSKTMLAIDGAGFDWSFMADKEVLTDMALMAFSDSEFNKSKFNLATYKRGLASVEEQLVFYKKNELEKLKQEKESNQLKIEKFDNASKSLDKLIGSQIPDKSRKGLGFVSYNDVPPPPKGLFSPLTLDLSYSDLEEFQQPKFEGYGPKSSKSVSEDISNEVRESPYASLVEELVSNDKLEKKIVFPTITKINFVRPQQQEKPVRKLVKYAEMYRSQTPRGNQRNWNNQKSQQLGSDFVMYNKACLVCGSFDHVQALCNYHQKERMVSGNKYTRVNYNYSDKKAHLSAHWNIVPRAVLMKTGLRPHNTARPVNTAHPKTIVYSARPMSHFSKSAQSTVKRPYQIKIVLTNKIFCQKVNIAKGKVNTVRPNSAVVNAVMANQINVVKASTLSDDLGPQRKLISQKEDQGYFDSGCSRHMTGNMSYLLDFKEFDGGYVTFGGGAKGGRITCKGTLKTGKLDFEDVYFVKELQFNLFSVSQMCDKKNSVLFTNTGCFILSPDFKLADESQVLLKVPRKNNMYSVDMKNIVPKESLTCLVAKVTLDESMLWHGRLASKDETSGILKSFITQIENLVDKKVKIIRCDNETEFKNRVMSEFCEKKGIKREFSIARTPQQNGVAERRNRTLIEAARTMLADSKLPTTFWAEAVNTACYVQNRVLVVKPHNKTPYEHFRGRTSSLSFIKPFGFHVTILNTLDHLGKFDGKSDDGFFVGYSLNSKAFRVYNIRTRKVEENLHVRFLEDKLIITGDGPKWLFDIDVLTKSMNYVPVVAGTNSNDFVGAKESIGADRPLVLQSPLPVRLPVLPPRGAEVARPALRVVILGGIIHTGEDIGNVRTRIPASHQIRYTNALGSQPRIYDLKPTSGHLLRADPSQT
ncbi:ribonuclease H-like domain-containing protein [Tanacetum coccineum]